MSRARTVLLFGTSANPPTGLGGHAGMVRWVASAPALPVVNPAALDGEVAEVRPDELWVLPVYQHAFADKREMPAFEHRLAMARLAFEHLTDVRIPVRVTDDERRVAASLGPGTRVGTIDVIRALQGEHPGVRFALLLGGDTHHDLVSGRWKASRELLATVPVVAVARDGAGPGNLADGPGNLADKVVGPGNLADKVVGPGNLADKASDEEASGGAGRAGTRTIPSGDAGPGSLLVVPGLTAVSSREVRATRDPARLGDALQPEVLSYILTHGLYGLGPALH